MKQIKISFLILILIAFGSLLFGITMGSVALKPSQLVSALINTDDPISRQIIYQIRLPRALAAFVTGGLLALAGALMQILLRNPLADPYVLGISGGAAVASLLGILCGLTGLGLTGSAWAGSLLAVFLVFALAKRNKHWHAEHVLLTGIAIASGFAAITSFILLISPNAALRGMLFWLLGDLSYAHWPFWEGGILLLGLVLSLSMAKQLNIVMRGELQAEALGIDTNRLHIHIYFLCSLLTATAVSLAGCIGFVGLIIPHFLRLLIGSDHRHLLPGCVLLGGSFVTLADVVARSALAPQQLPVGMVMAFIGIPIFIVLLQK